MESSPGCCSPNWQSLLHQFALVSYIPAPLGTFLDALRVQLVPDCRPRAHVSILPPRSLCGPTEQAIQEIRSRAVAFQPFTVQLGEVCKFDASSVVYLDITSGLQELNAMYRAMNAGCSTFSERFRYCPHITIAQNISPEQAQVMLEAAKKAWAGYSFDRAFRVDALSFVQNQGEYNWADLATVSLKAPRKPPMTVPGGPAVPLHSI